MEADYPEKYKLSKHSFVVSEVMENPSQRIWRSDLLHVKDCDPDSLILLFSVAF